MARPAKWSAHRHPFSHVTYPSSLLPAPIVPPPREGHRRRFNEADKRRILEEVAQPSRPIRGWIPVGLHELVHETPASDLDLAIEYHRPVDVGCLTEVTAASEDWATELKCRFGHQPKFTGLHFNAGYDEVAWKARATEAAQSSRPGPWLGYTAESRPRARAAQRRQHPRDRCGGETS
jgi:hypothetical protein